MYLKNPRVYLASDPSHPGFQMMSSSGLGHCPQELVRLIRLESFVHLSLASDMESQVADHMPISGGRSGL